MKNTKVLYFFLFIILESLPAQTLNLQTIPSDKMQFGVSFEKPFYPNNYRNYSTLSGVYNSSFNIEYLGIALLTSATNNFSNRLIHILNFGTLWKGSTITPKIFYKFYLKENMRNKIDGVLGIGITLSIDKQ